MDYNKLKYFVEVAEKKSISKAAKVLKRTQSAISQQVRKLEEELQTKLFERIGKQIVLTPEGQEIFELAKEKLGDLDKQLDWVISKGQNLKGRIHVGYLQDHATPFPLFELLVNFRKRYPQIDFEVSYDINSNIEEKLLDNKYDIGFLLQFEKRELFETIQVSTAAHFVVTSKEYLEKNGPFQTIDKVLDADLIDFDLNFFAFKAWVRKNFENKLPELIHRTPDLIVPNHIAAQAIVEGGHGIAILPEYLIEDSLRKGRILKLLPQIKESTVWLDLGIQKSKMLQLYEQAFVDFIKESIK
jgi:DNA-binding transcriptional LysR family regulator